MNTKSPDVSRRQFLKTSSVLTAGVLAAPHIIATHAAPDDPIRVGLIGCGSRGLGAVANAVTAAPNVKLVALADLFPDRLEAARAQLAKIASSAGQGASWAAGTESRKMAGIDLNVPEDRCFAGWDSYKELLKLPDVNYVILATPPGFRPIHFKAAVEAGKHAFLEKPVAVDVWGVKTVMEAGKMAKEKGLGMVAGTQRRHQNNYLDVVKRIQDGAIGEIRAARAYWCQGGLWHKTREPQWSDMEYQLRNWMYFNWLSGDIIVEQHLHNIDVINWVLGEHPIKAKAVGGRTVRTGAEYGDIWDHFYVEFEYPNDVRMSSLCRQWDNTSGEIGEAVVGTKGISNCQSIIKGETNYRFRGKIINPYDQEHTDLINSIREGKPLNEAQQVAESNLAAIMGREAAYSGQVIDWDSALEADQNLAPKEYAFGKMPELFLPIPGKYTTPLNA